MCRHELYHFEEIRLDRAIEAFEARCPPTMEERDEQEATGPGSTSEEERIISISRRGAHADLELYDTICDRQSQSRYTAKRQLEYHQREAHRIEIQLRGRQIESKILRTATHESEVQEFRQKLKGH